MLPLKILVLEVLWAVLFVLPASANPCAGAESQLSQATQALAQGSLAEAEQLLTQLQTSHPQCQEVVLGLGRLRAAQGDTFSAQMLLSLYTELAPKDGRGYYYLASFLFSRRDYRRAEAMSERALVFEPNYAEALTLQGRILLMKGQVDRAEQALAKACQLAPENAEAHFEMGKLYDSNHQSSEAVPHFEKVVALNPKDPRAYDYLALNLEPLGEFERAERAYKKGLEVNQGPIPDAFLDYNYGRFLLTQNRLLEAKGHLDRALQLAPNTRAVHFEHARLNLRLKDYQAARRDAERALSLKDPGDFVLDLQIYYQLATIYTRLGEKDLAEKYTQLSQSTSVPIKGYRMRR